MNLPYPRRHVRCKIWSMPLQTSDEVRKAVRGGYAHGDTRTNQHPTVRFDPTKQQEGGRGAGESERASAADRTGARDGFGHEAEFRSGPPAWPLTGIRWRK